jgi:hypothetical protein
VAREFNIPGPETPDIPSVLESHIGDSVEI